jgi:hypothetical protein
MTTHKKIYSAPKIKTLFSGCETFILSGSVETVIEGEQNTPKSDGTGGNQETAGAKENHFSVWD